METLNSFLKDFIKVSNNITDEFKVIISQMQDGNFDTEVITVLSRGIILDIAREFFSLQFETLIP